MEPTLGNGAGKVWQLAASLQMLTDDYRYRFTGTGPSLVSSRVSYAFDLRGPSKAVDTACSSASVALHDAILALRAGDADQILVGGSNLILDPDKMSIISSMS